MTFVTPVDGQPALASHVSQITDALTGARAEPITLAGNLRIQKNLPALFMRRAADAFDMGFMDNTGFGFGPTTGTGYDVLLARNAGAFWDVTGHLVPAATYDLGTTGNRWRKVWATDAEFTNAPLVGGSPLLAQTTGDARYLQLAGGNVMTGSLGPSTDGTRDLGTPSLHWRKLYATDADLGLLGFNADTYLSRISAGTLRVANGPGTFGALYLGDTLLQRTATGALRLDTLLGMGVAPAAWHSARVALQFGGAGVLTGNVGGAGALLGDNTYLDSGVADRALVTAPATRITFGYTAGAIRFENAPSVAAGAAQTFVLRALLDANGNLALTPAAGTAALSIGGTAQPKITVASGAPSSPMTGDLWVW